MADNVSPSVPNEGEDENPMTLDDFIEEESKLVNDALAVLGSSDDKNCTYSLGYVKRQALYACITCTPQNELASRRAGICLACSYHCHEGHDLIELYTKRLFRCDCGNSKFSGKKCNLEPNKCDNNENNLYNQNFKGLYCTCARPYPDPDDETPDEMIQCIICEDWYHTRHLHSQLQEGSLSNNYSEMICGSCTSKLTFLKYYVGLAVSPVSKNESVENISSSEINVDQCSTEVSTLGVATNGTADQGGNDSATESRINGENKEEYICDAERPVNDNKGSGSVDTSLNTQESDSNEGCLLSKMKPLAETDYGNNATFWPSSFRSSLCSCTSCKKTYMDLNIPWILDESDTVQAYEEEGLRKAESVGSVHPERFLNNELAKFNRYQQVELIQNYNDFKSSLSEFLGKFAQEKKVVRKQDIDEFFEDMQAKKRRRIGTPPYNCH